MGVWRRPIRIGCRYRRVRDLDGIRAFTRRPGTLDRDLVVGQNQRIGPGAVSSGLERPYRMLDILSAVLRQHRGVRARHGQADP